MTCGLDGEEVAEVGVVCDLGVLKAPVDDFCKRSNSSCSLGGRRGGAGPVANAGRREDWEKYRRIGSRNLGGSWRDIVGILDLLVLASSIN